MDPLEEFDLSDWESRIPLDNWVKQDFGICGPGDIVRLECCRELARASFKPVGTVPTDVFVFALGEPPRRDMTMVGGAPYRPADAAWPLSRAGEPMIFLAQFRFSESKDLIGDLPGEMLLVFAEDRDLHVIKPQEFLRFEWYPLKIDRVVEPRDIPSPTRSWEWDFVHCYGQRFRTIDYQNAVPLELLESIMCPRFIPTPPNLQDTESVARVQGAKIGGIPAASYGPFGKRRADSVPGRFICSLASIVPDLWRPFPWLNHPDPITTFPLPSDACLEFSAGFVLNLYLQESRDVRWVMHML